MRLGSAHPFDPPAIDPNYLATVKDKWLATEIVRHSRRIGEAKPFEAVGAREIYPGPEVQADEDILDYIRRTGTTTWHLSGTCKMGMDETAVVDPKLRVHGMEGLRVVDRPVGEREHVLHARHTWTSR